MSLALSVSIGRMQGNNTLNAFQQLCAPSGVTFVWRKWVGLRIIIRNNTLQAYPAVHCSDAQTGGLLLSGVCHALL